MTDGAPFLYLHPDGIMSSFTIPTVYLIAGLLLSPCLHTASPGV